jgi:hypothetical protein
VQDVCDFIQSGIKCSFHSDVGDDGEREVVQKWLNRRLRLDSVDLCFATYDSSDDVASPEGSDKYFEANMSRNTRNLTVVMLL